MDRRAMSADAESDPDETPDHIIVAGGEEYHKKHVGGALAVMGGALTALVITAPIGIPLFAIGLWQYLKYR